LDRPTNVTNETFFHEDHGNLVPSDVREGEEDKPFALKKTSQEPIHKIHLSQKVRKKICPLFAEKICSKFEKTIKIFALISPGNNILSRAGIRKNTTHTQIRTLVFEPQSGLPDKIKNSIFCVFLDRREFVSVVEEHMVEHGVGLESLLAGCQVRRRE
jgi:hypothetical protein